MLKKEEKWWSKNGSFKRENALGNTKIELFGEVWRKMGGKLKKGWKNGCTGIAIQVGGMMARQLFPGGVIVPNDPDTAVAKTAELIEAEVPVIYEAAFMHYGVFVAVDILVRDGNAYKLFEVKSSTELKETYLQDLSS